MIFCLIYISFLHISFAFYAIWHCSDFFHIIDRHLLAFIFFIMPLFHILCYSSFIIIAIDTFLIIIGYYIDSLFSLWLFIIISIISSFFEIWGYFPSFSPLFSLRIFILFLFIINRYFLIFLLLISYFLLHYGHCIIFIYDYFIFTCH